jgi:uncharacterized protein (DUF2062 family)
MSIADVRRRLHQVEERMPPRIRAFVAGKGRPLLALNRRAVARGVALGIFLGLVVPLGQFPAAVLLSPMFRANVLASLGGTLITNPLTFPPIYAAAYVVGGWVLGAFAELGLTAAWFGAPPNADGGAAPEWLPRIVVGLGLFATTGAVVAYHVIAYWWTRATHRRWRARRVTVAPRLA